MRCVALVQLLFLAVPTRAAELYVDPVGGDDSASGQSPDKPLRTLPAALKVLSQGGFTAVNLRAGAAHQVKSTLEITAAHGGTPSAPVEFRPYDGASATVSGAVSVTGWKQKGTVGSSQTTLWAAPLPAAVATAGLSAAMQLWRDGQRQTLARTPRMSFSSCTESTITFKPGQVPGNLTTIGKLNGTQVVLYESWTASIHTISSLDAANNTIKLTTNWNEKWATGASGSRFYFQNNFALVDTDGEFFVDLEARVVYYAGTDPTNAVMSLAVPVELVHVDGASDITFRNITFEFAGVETEACLGGQCDGQSASFLMTSAVHVVGATRATFQRVTVRHTGGYGIWLDNATQYSTISYSALSDLGAGGVRLGSSTSSGTQGNNVTDNVLEDGGWVYQEGCGVLAQKVSSTFISHNEIRRFRYTGVSTGWTWGYAPTNVFNVVTEFNHIYDIGQGYLSDMGCVYTLGYQPGSQVVNNVCHDVQSYDYGGWGYYTDEGSRGELFRDNIAVRTKCAGHHQHYGTDNTLTNNIYSDVNIGDVSTPGRPEIIMASCDEAIRSSQHSCPKPTQQQCCEIVKGGCCSSFNFSVNVVVQPESYTGALIGSVQKFGLDNFTFEKNVYWVGGRAASNMWNMSTWTAWRDRDKDEGSLYADPLCQDINCTSGSFQPKSPALGMGFRPIDVSRVGPRDPAVGAPGAMLNVADVREALSSPDIESKGLLKGF